MQSLNDLSSERGIKSFDYSLPQDWFDAVLKLTGESPSGHIVWSYDWSIMGHPQAIDATGDRIIGRYASIVR